MNSTPSSASIVGGARWSSISAAFGSASDLARIGFVAIFLPPAEIGLAAFTMVLLHLATFIQDGGIGSGLVRHERVDSLTFCSLFWFNVLWALTLSCTIFLLAPVAATTFAMPRLELLLAISSLIFFFSSLGQVQRSMLLRDLRYRELAFSEMTSAVVGTLVTVLLVLVEPTALSMVVGRLAQVTTVTVLVALLVIRQHPVRFAFSWTRVREFLRFGTFVTVDRVFEYLGSQADRFFIGIFFDLSVLGVYHIAANLTTMMARNFGTRLVFRVVYPAMSKAWRVGETPVTLMLQTHQFILVFMATPLLFAAVLFMMFGGHLPLEWQLAAPLTQILVFAAILILLWQPLRACMLTFNRAENILATSFVSNITMLVGCFLAAHYLNVFAVALVLCGSHLLRTGLMLYWMHRKGMFEITPAVRVTAGVAGGILALTVLAQTLLVVADGGDGWAGGVALLIMAAASALALLSHRRLVAQVARAAVEPLPWPRRQPSGE